MNGLCLVGAAGLFWLAWMLMPGVGVTDPEQIFALVGSQRPMVALSVLVQLVSAALYVPALMNGAVGRTRDRIPLLRWAAPLLVVGAMGSAADAVLHLLAYAMTAPGVDQPAMLPVMAFMQGQGLVLLAPMILSFFAGGAMLSIAVSRAGLTSNLNPRLHAIALVVAVAGAGLASAGLISGRVIGLTFLGLISAAQAWSGLALRSASSADLRVGLAASQSVRV
jgi:hypothetical protein